MPEESTQNNPADETKSDTEEQKRKKIRPIWLTDVVLVYVCGGLVFVLGVCGGALLNSHPKPIVLAWSTILAAIIIFGLGTRFWLINHRKKQTRNKIPKWIPNVAFLLFTIIGLVFWGLAVLREQPIEDRPAKQIDWPEAFDGSTNRTHIFWVLREHPTMELGAADNNLVFKFGRLLTQEGNLVQEIFVSGTATGIKIAGQEALKSAPPPRYALEINSPMYISGSAFEASWITGVTKILLPFEKGSEFELFTKVGDVKFSIFDIRADSLAVRMDIYPPSGFSLAPKHGKPVTPFSPLPKPFDERLREFLDRMDPGALTALRNGTDHFTGRIGTKHFMEFSQLCSEMGASNFINAIDLGTNTLKTSSNVLHSIDFILNRDLLRKSN
jgi:hypothetical protein